MSCILSITKYLYIYSYQPINRSMKTRYRYLAAFIFLVIIGAGCKKSASGPGTGTTKEPDVVPVTTSVLSKALGCNCTASDFSGTVSFTSPVMKAEDVTFLLPLGLMQKGHVTPIDHQYYFPLNILGGASAPEYPVYSPAAGYIVRIQRAPLNQVEAHLESRDGYDILIQHSCSVYTYLQLTTSLPDQISAALGPLERGKSKEVKIAVTAGQQVARVGGQSLDLTVFDENVPEKQWIVPGHYTELGKKYKSDAFLFYTDAVKAPLLAKLIGATEPRGGRFDYDIDGKLVGGWFLQGTNGYDGIPNQGNDYWRGHLVFGYFTMNRASMEISIGRWNEPGASENDIKGGWQFAVKNNGPDPKEVSISSGLVKYEVTTPMYVRQDNNQGWDQQTFQGQLNVTSGASKGIILVQMMENRLIKVEAFPGKSAAEVTGFTSGAQLY